MDSSAWTGRYAPEQGGQEPSLSTAEQVRKELGLDDNTEVRFIAADAESIQALRNILKGFSEEPKDVYADPAKEAGVKSGRQVASEKLQAKYGSNAPRVADVTFDVFKEVLRAMDLHAPMHTPHEGSSVIREEFEELWDEVKADRGYTSAARKEAIQLAAMAVRYVLDLDPDNDRV